MLKSLGISIITTILCLTACSGPRLGAVVERSAFAGGGKEVTGLTYVRSVRVEFPRAGGPSKPSCVLATPGGELVVVDGETGRAGRFELDGRFVSYLEAPGAFSPSAAALGPGLSIYLLDSFGGDICRYDATGQLAGRVSVREESSRLIDICFDKAGTAYVTDREEDVVHVLHGDAWAESGLGGFGAGPGMLIDPGGVDVDAQDRIYVCDAGNSRVQVLDQWGGVLGVWPVNGDDCEARPGDVAVDRWGNAFVTDTGCSCLRVLNASGVETFRLEGDGPGLRFTESPGGIDVVDGRLYVADSIAAAIQVFDIRYEI
jgi:DNA-binding beta-propeller fold protein YncE